MAALYLTLRGYLSSQGFPSATMEIALTNQHEQPLQRPLRSISLDPFAAYILKVIR
jgi:hypothetical protein